MLEYTDQKTGNDVDGSNENGCHRVPLREARSAVHGPIKLRFASQHLALGAGLILIDQACIQIGIHRHLFARHGIQGETRGYFGNADRAVIDHHILDGDQY